MEPEKIIKPKKLVNEPVYHVPRSLKDDWNTKPEPMIKITDLTKPQSEFFEKLSKTVVKERVKIPNKKVVARTQPFVTRIEPNYKFSAIHVSENKKIATFPYSLYDDVYSKAEEFGNKTLTGKLEKAKEEKEIELERFNSKEN